MGNCLGKSSHHERLNEFHYSYFETVQARNLLSRSTKRHPWRKKDSALSGLGNTPIMTEFDQQDEETTFLESPHSLATTTQSSTVSLPQHEQNHQHQRHQEATFGEKGWDPLSIDDSVDAWKERKRGAALELRLAKNRYLQFVSSALMNQDLSPVSLDSKIQSPRYFHPTNMKEKLNNEFENAIANGVIWEEVTRPKKVSAIAVSRNDTWLEGRSSLLFAIGTEDGVLTLIEIQDEPLKWSDQSVDSGGPVCQNFGAQVELPLVGRIRAIDFSPDGAYLVAGGDGCIAYLVAIVRHESTKALKDMKVLRQVERVDRIYAVRFSPDSQSLAFGGFDSKIAFGTIASFLSKERPLLTEAPVSGLVFCMDWSEAYVAVGTSGDNGFAIVDNSHNLVRCISRPSSVEALKWKPDGTLLAVGDREVVVYDSETFDIKCEICEALRSHDTTSHKYRVSALCWSPDGSFLAIGGSDGICFVVETSGFTLVHELRRPCRIVSLAWGQQRMLNGERKRFLGISDDSCKVALLKAGIETDESTAGDEDILSSPSASFNTGTTSEWVLREGCFRDVEDVLAERPPRSKAEGTITSIAFSRCSKSRSSSYLAYVSEDCSLTILSTHDWSAILVSESNLPMCLFFVRIAVRLTYEK
jgi:WD40 repeat protein